MDVILDSNIYVSDFAMTGNGFRALFDYLRPLGCSLVVPDCVLEEVTATYRRKFREALEKAQPLRRMMFVPEGWGLPDVEKNVADLAARLSPSYRDPARERVAYE